MDQRLQCLAICQKEQTSAADLCRAYGISRPTAYRRINRHARSSCEMLSFDETRFSICPLFPARKRKALRTTLGSPFQWRATYRKIP
jgi:hypothetical protein